MSAWQERFEAFLKFCTLWDLSTRKGATGCLDLRQWVGLFVQDLPSDLAVFAIFDPAAEHIECTKVLPRALESWPSEIKSMYGDRTLGLWEGRAAPEN